MEQSSSRMHVSSWGYACFLTVNATSIWGGVFPFLPLEFQTAEITLTFFLAQALAFGGAFVASMLGSYYFPRGARVMLVSLSALLVFAGSACLIAAMYVQAATLPLVFAGGVLLGIGCAGMFMLWQRYFASLPSAEGNLRLIVGTAIAPLIYFALYLVPIALTAFLIPLVFVPCAAFASRFRCARCTWTSLCSRTCRSSIRACIGRWWPTIGAVRCAWGRSRSPAASSAASRFCTRISAQW